MKKVGSVFIKKIKQTNKYHVFSTLWLWKQYVITLQANDEVPWQNQSQVAVFFPVHNGHSTLSADHLQLFPLYTNTYQSNSSLKRPLRESNIINNEATIWV